MHLPLDYNIAVEHENTTTFIDWEKPGRWITQFRPILDIATSIALVPKTGKPLPAIRVMLNDTKRWIIFSRVFYTTQGQKRLYAIGWQTTVRGLNVKSITWVLPDGSIQNAEEPSI